MHKAFQAFNLFNSRPFKGIFYYKFFEFFLLSSLSPSNPQTSKKINFYLIISLLSFFFFSFLFMPISSHNITCWDRIRVIDSLNLIII